MTVVTTHHNGLKMYASKTSGVLNASVEFDEATLRPTFRLIHGIPGNSSGIEIARRLGLDDALLSHAQQLVSREEQAIAEYSKNLRAEIAKSSKLREQVESEHNDLDTRRMQLEEQHAEFERAKKKEIEQSWQRAWDLFQGETKKLIPKFKTSTWLCELEGKSEEGRSLPDEVQRAIFLC